MEIALPDKNEILMAIDEMIDEFMYKTSHIIQKKEKILHHLQELFEQNSLDRKIDMKLKEIDMLKSRFEYLTKSILDDKNLSLESLKSAFFTSSPKNKIKKHEDEISLIKKSLDASIGELLKIKENLIPTKEEFQKRALNVVFLKQKEVNSLKDAFELSNPKKREKEGFGEVVKDNKRVALEDLQKGDIFDLQNTSTIITAKVLNKK